MGPFKDAELELLSREHPASQMENTSCFDLPALA